MREQKERGCLEAEEARRSAKPMLQKFTEKDDVESYLDMFEHAAAQQEWLKETWATQLARLLSETATPRLTLQVTRTMKQPSSSDTQCQC